MRKFRDPAEINICVTFCFLQSLYMHCIERARGVGLAKVNRQDLPRGPEGAQMKARYPPDKGPEGFQKQRQRLADRLRFVNQERHMGRPWSLRLRIGLTGIVKPVQLGISFQTAEQDAAVTGLPPPYSR